MREAWKEYTLGRQTLNQLSQKYKKSVSTIQRKLDKHEGFELATEIKTERPINLIFDATFLKRREGILIFRANGKTLHWKWIETERVEDIEEGLKALEKQGYTFKSFTVDGRKGVLQKLKESYPKAHLQMCHYHQIAIVRRYTTTNPKTDCGKALWELTKALSQLSREAFQSQLEFIQQTYSDFLKERNESNGFKHRRLRSALRSLKTHLSYLFTYQEYPNLNIPNTTNSCEGFFSHFKEKLQIHRGLHPLRKRKLINSLLASSRF